MGDSCLPDRLLILGAGGLGREIFSFAERHPDAGSRWIIGGFLDDDVMKRLPGEHPATIVGSIAEYQPSPTDILVNAIGNPVVRERCCTMLKARGAKFLTFVHATALVGRNVHLGEGVVLLANVNLTCDISVGDHTIFLTQSGAGHDSVVGKYCQISSGCDIMGGAKLGDRVLLGSGARVLPRVVVGNDAIVGAGSVAIRSVLARETVFGAPARRLVLGGQP